jgi:hypothetical protein
VKLSSDFARHRKAVEALRVRRVPFTRFIDGNNVIIGDITGCNRESMKVFLDKIAGAGDPK